MATNGSGNSVSIRDERGRYLKGMAGGPGRPPGSRNRLTERHAVEVAITDEAIGKLTEISRSRTEAASRVARAQMLLRYAEKPSFYAVGQRLGVHHQTVQRCVERALAYGAPTLAFLTAPTIRFAWNAPARSC
jgi:hypothetical protein